MNDNNVDIESSSTNVIDESDSINHFAQLDNKQPSINDSSNNNNDTNVIVHRKINPNPITITTIYDNNNNNRHKTDNYFAENPMRNGASSYTKNEKFLIKVKKYATNVFIAVMIIMTIVILTFLIPQINEKDRNGGAAGRSSMINDAIYRRVNQSNPAFNQYIFSTRNDFYKNHPDSNCNLLNIKSKSYMKSNDLMSLNTLFNIGNKSRMIVDNVTELFEHMDSIIINSKGKIDFICTFHLSYETTATSSSSSSSSLSNVSSSSIEIQSINHPCLCLWKPKMADISFKIIDVDLNVNDLGNSANKMMIVEEEYFNFRNKEDKHIKRKIPQKLNITIVDFEKQTIMIEVEKVDVASITSMYNDWINKKK